MKTDYSNIRFSLQHCMHRDSGNVEVSGIELAELLAAYDALAHPAAPKGKYSAEFEEAWAEYPTRPGNSKAAAWKAWTARLKAKVPPETLVEGVRRYAAYCKAKGTEPEYVKMASTFFGPAEHYAADWTVPRAAEPRRQAGDRREQKKADSNAEALRILDGIPAYGGDVIEMEDCHGPR